MKKEAQVHMLPTNGKDIAMLSKRVKDGMLQSANGPEGVANCNTMWQPQHLYFTTDEEIKEGDLCYDEGASPGWNGIKNISKCLRTDKKGYWNKRCNKIIASTDPKLLADGLPQPSQAFIEKFCKVGGIDEVDVEYERVSAFEQRGLPSRLKINILKVDPVHNTITTHRIVEKKYSIDDIEAYCDKYPNDAELGREIRKLRYKQ